MKEELESVEATPNAGVQRGASRRLGIIGVALLALTFAACGLVRTGYNHADDLAYRWVDEWVDVNDQQKPQLQAELVAWHRWHRQTQLGDYAQWLAKTADAVARDTTAADVCRLTAEVSERIDRATERLLPQAAQFALTLTEQQLTVMQKRFDKGQQKFRDEYLKGDSDDREKAVYKRSVSQAETLYGGDLDNAQKDVLKQAAKTSLFEPQLLLQERATRHKELQALIRGAQKRVSDGTPRDNVASDLEKQLRQWLQQGRQSPRAATAAYQQRVRDHGCELSARVHNVAGLKAREAARVKLKGWEADAKALMATAS